MKEVNKERLFELLADQTVFGLNEEESVELQRLKAEFPEWERDISFELAAAFVNLAGLDLDENLPADLRAKVSKNALEFFNKQTGSAQITSDSAVKFTPNIKRKFETETKGSFWQWLGWGLAATACLVLAVDLWTTHSVKQPVVVAKLETSPTPKPELTAAEQRERLIASTPDIIRSSWTEANPKNPKNISGDIVWSNTAQKGFMRFRGLPANDPNKEAYQLWIVDETQDAKTPISGGVFDVNSDGEVVVPINAQIKVRKPKAFAVTKEKPGGVVVSKQEEVMTIAKI